MRKRSTPAARTRAIWQSGPWAGSSLRAYVVTTWRTRPSWPGSWHVMRARVTQIMDLLGLAPDIKEELLFLPPVQRGRDPLVLRDLLPIAAEPDWQRQRRMWREARKAFRAEAREHGDECRSAP
ncbi:hypothetical protein JCM17478_01340 [Thermopirellula anaerolimosa]